MSVETITSSIEGKLLTRDDFMMWGPQKFDEFFVFLEFFWSGHKWEATEDIIRTVEEYASSGAACREYVERIGMSLPEGGMTAPFKNKYRLRVTRMLLSMRNYLQEKNPGALSPITAKKYRYKVQYEWLRELYDDDGKVKFVNQEPEKVTVTEVETVSPETQLLSGGVPVNARLLSAIEKVITVYETIAGSVTMEDIKKMKPMDKISALNKLSYLHAALGKSKISTKFTQINVNTSSKEDLEKSLIQMSDDEE